MLCERCEAEIEWNKRGRLPPGFSGVLYVAEDGGKQRLPKRERQILEILWARRDRIVSRNSMMALLYGGDADPPYEAGLNVRIHFLRKRLAPTSFRIITAYREGWQLVAEEKEQ